MSKPAISNFYYVDLFSRSFQCFLGLFSIRYLQRFHFTHSNVQIKEWIRKLLLNVYLFLFQHNNMLVKQKLIDKSLGEKYQAVIDLISLLQSKILMKLEMKCKLCKTYVFTKRKVMAC